MEIRYDDKEGNSYDERRADDEKITFTAQVPSHSSSIVWPFIATEASM